MIAPLIAVSLVWVFFSPKTFWITILCATILWSVATFPLITLLVIAVFYIAMRLWKKSKRNSENK